MSGRRARQDQARGFTLVELLIVVVVLGILATVTMLAVRGITAKGADSTCEADRQMLETAVDAFSATRRAVLSEDVLVGAGYLRSHSDNFDVAPDGAIVPQAGGLYHCT